ncbi:hypothetical protein VAEKB19_3770002 [Vibrio aestuarianus]|nr:hypothetical protein VAEKB19_3770002 [Vibrio aestuarianus]
MVQKQANFNLADLVQQKCIAEVNVLSNGCVAIRVLCDGLPNI